MTTSSYIIPTTYLITHENLSSGDSVTSNHSQNRVISVRLGTITALEAKITSKLLLNPIKPVLNPILRPNQNVFPPCRSTTAHTLALRRLLKGVKSHKSKSIITFVDFKEAFDCIQDGMMLKFLLVYGKQYLKRSLMTSAVFMKTPRPRISDQMVKRNRLTYLLVYYKVTIWRPSFLK